MNQQSRLTSLGRTTDALPPRRAVWDLTLAAWRSTRLFVVILLTLAVVLGAFYRFHRLARWDMNGDEAASWAAASAPSVKRVAGIEQRLDPGKLALYDTALHEWIGIFGDDLFAMRAMSAALGTIAIVLIFLTVRGVCRSLTDEPAAAVGEMAGAFAALMYATNLEMVLSDRVVRMYPLVLCAELLQIAFLLRAQRRGGILNYIGLAIFTAAMVAGNFTSTLLILAEALWLGWLLLAVIRGARSQQLAVFRPACAVVAGVALLTPWLPAAIASSHNAVKRGAIDWIKLQPIAWPYTTLRDSTGNQTLFWIFVALAAFGVWRQWRPARLIVEFFAAWMVGPMLAVMAITYLIHPLEFPRYILIAFVGMFTLAALGAASVRSTALRIMLAVLLIYLSAGPIRHGLKHSGGETAFREATLLAAQRTTPGEQVLVFPGWCVNVVRFYLPAARRDAAVPMTNRCGQAPVLILSGRSFASPEQIAIAQACYPHVIATLNLVEVRGR